MQCKDNQALTPPRATDPGWAHGTMVNGGRQKIKCKYCHKVFLGGGISRLKQHLAGERGNVAPCEVVPEEVKVQIQKHLDSKVVEKQKRQKEVKSGKYSSVLYYQETEERDEEDKVQVQSRSSALGTSRRAKEPLEGTSNRAKRQKKQKFSTASSVIAQPICQSFASQESIDQADIAVARFFYDAGIPFTAANSTYFQQMADAIAAVGPEPDVNAQVIITSGIKSYEESVGDFGRPVALRGRETLAPATWWSLFAADYPDLQRLAVRILSQNCSITPCKKSWTMFKCIRFKKRNQLENQRLNDLIFVHNNLHLQERRGDSTKVKSTKSKLDPVCLEAIDANMEDWIEDLGAVDGEEPSWMAITISSERMLANREILNMDDSNDSADDESCDITKGIDGNNHL
ncbi:hypothetical protein SLA2020_235290 [Shorea laevis]